MSPAISCFGKVFPAGNGFTIEVSMVCPTLKVHSIVLVSSRPRLTGTWDGGLKWTAIMTRIEFAGSLLSHTRWRSLLEICWNQACEDRGVNRQIHGGISRNQRVKENGSCTHVSDHVHMEYRQCRKAQAKLVVVGAIGSVLMVHATKYTFNHFSASGCQDR